MKGPNRRTLLRSGAAVALAATTAAVTACEPGKEGAGRRMPSEAQRHARTFMAWPPTDSEWADWAGDVQGDIARIARTIAGFEPVVLLAAPAEVKAARRACGSGVEVIPVAVDDLWVRDTGPTFVTGPKGLAGIDFHFNGWGGKQDHRRDEKVARTVLTREGVPRVDAPITAEGGSLEVDGHGTLMVTESSLVNPNRNPGRSRDEIEKALKELLGVTTVIWFTGVRGQDITDCHVDALARFTDDGAVLLSRPHPAGGADVWSRAYDQARAVLETATDARGRKPEIVDLPEPDPAALGRRGPDFLGSYANYYVVNDAVIVPRFGDRTADRNAVSIIGELHPGRKVVPVQIDTVAEGGGGIHCATQQQPDQLET
ncbi:agmatine deiminase family protein [Streptomyces sp. CB03238]|uniref:agmatine deiminase family protein n=1 Tax=Streptomyces sp. CB03238 TaxID=1907777 RepID=UPI000A10049F|nr:agmatine deiminase family protein [Streptomyces sp. CB03238]ORT60595.1 peptidyl-arginine deiminase [Streptomyces sp. CB03238]